MMVGVAVLSLVGMAACGDDETDDSDRPADAVTDDEPAPVDDTAGRSTDESPAPAPAPSDERADESPAPGGDGATVTVGELSYDFELMFCEVADNGALSGSGLTSGSELDAGSAGMAGAFVEFRIQAEGAPNQEVMPFGEEHFITISDSDEGLDWNAGGGQFLGSVTFEDSYIDSWSLDGATASGTALFIEEGEAYQQGAEAVSVPGTFDIRCEG